LNYHTISSPLGTQIPQAVGVAYKLKLDNAKKKDVATEGGCAITIFGDGAASTGDFHAACNFAATLECPIIFFCRNNGYAISTSVKDQYRGDGVIGRAPGYGMAAIRVDGNDLFAVHSATKLARDYAIQNNQPVMIEAMTYRGGHHSTSDDSTRYRSKDEVKYWTTENDPLTRLLHFCQKNGKENAFSEQTKISDEERMAVRKALEKAESRQGPKISTLFEDVYSKVPSLLQRQEAEHMEHIKKYPEFYQDRD
jgi:2-oxoisovalerate dehydrogenase E1 component alpha subunit